MVWAYISPVFIPTNAQRGGSVIVCLSLRVCRFLGLCRFFSFLLFLLRLGVRLRLVFCAFCRSVEFELALERVCVLCFGAEPLSWVIWAGFGRLCLSSLHGGRRRKSYRVHQLRRRYIPHTRSCEAKTFILPSVPAMIPWETLLLLLS